MALVSTGNALATPYLQPGYTLTSDGFGLVTCSATYKVDWTASVAITSRGTAFPIAGLTYLKAHKSSQSYDALEYKTIKVDYVGIDPTINGGVRTNPNTTVANGLTAENITTHPNFFTHASGYTPGALAGLPADFGGLYDDSTLGPPVSVISATTGKPVVVPSSEGYNGACFETGMGGRFIGFVDPDVPELYGKTQYLARTTTYSGVAYYNDASFVQALYLLLGTATGTNSWGASFPLIPSWGPTGTGIHGKQNLLSQINVEEYGTLFKVMYEIRYSKEGWPPDVYVNI
ncbi:hypothetical protein K0U83_24390 [bacterium]|nr:hypothetical protein [bacterium]